MRAEMFLSWFGETTLAVSALVLAVLILRKPFAAWFGARAAYALWLAPVIRLFLPELKLLPAPAAPLEQTFAWAATAEPATAFLAKAPAPFPASLAPAAFAPPEFDALAVLITAAVIVWGFGAFAWVSHQLETQRRYLKAMRASSERAPESVVGEARAIAPLLGLKRLPELRIMNDARADSGPCVAGLLRPVVFLPAGFAEQFTCAERRLALAHELAHIARGDLVAALAAMLLRAAQWPNPLAHFAWRSFRIDQEAACDAFVLARCSARKEDAGEYAAAIMKSLRIGAPAAPAFGLSLSHPVKERLMLLKKSKTTPLRLLAGVSAAALLTLGGLAATADYGYAAEKDKKVEKTRHRSHQIITVDDGETMSVNGNDNVGKYEIIHENGTRTVRVYDRNGKLLTEDVYGPEDEMPIWEVIVTDKDGKTHKMKYGARYELGAHPPIPPLPPVPAADGARRVMILKGENGDLMKEFAFDTEFFAVGEHPMMVFSDDDGNMMTFNKKLIGHGGMHCMSDGDEEPVILEWTDKGAKDGKHDVIKQVLCLTGEDAKPENRAEALRKAIARMEDDAKRDAERRKEMIAQMKEELKKAEKTVRK